MSTVRIIFHLEEKNEFKGFLKIYNEKKEFSNDKEITFNIPDKKFREFQSILPSKLYVLDSKGKKYENYTLNLVKGNNTYHFFNGNIGYSFELLFYDEKDLIISVGNNKIEEYDQCSKIKRFSFINLKSKFIKINDVEIDLLKFLPKDFSRYNSFQYSFYDVKEAYIVSKKIAITQNQNMLNYYKNNNKSFNNFSSELSNMIKTIKINKKEFKEQFIKLNDKYDYLINSLNNLDLNLPKNELKRILNEDFYFYMFYTMTQAKIFFIYYLFNKFEDIGPDDFCSLFDKLSTIKEQLINDKKIENFEKISILSSFSILYLKMNSVQKLMESEFHYIKVDQVDENSSINIAMNFLKEFIKDLNEDSPSFFKLIEINSKFGYYKDEKMFTFDMLSLSDLKSHLEEVLPSVICFYYQKNTDVHAFVDKTTYCVNINMTKLYEFHKIIKVDKNPKNEEKYAAKNIAMKIAKNIIHECFGHKKFSFCTKLSKKSKSITPIKCFENKRIKKLVPTLSINKEDNINILYDDKKSDSGKYFESSFGKIPNKKFYSFSYLNKIKNDGNLLDNPKLFTDKSKLEILQNYCYYKYLYENNNKGKDIEELNLLSFEEEYNYLINKFKNNDNKVEINNNNNLLTDESNNTEKNDFLSKKRKRTKAKKLTKIKKNKELKIDEEIMKQKICGENKENTEEINTSNQPEKEINETSPSKRKNKKKKKIRLSNKKIERKLITSSLTFDELKYYLNLYFESSYLV